MKPSQSRGLYSMCDEISIKQLSQLKSIKGNDTNTYRERCCAVIFTHFIVATASIRTQHSIDFFSLKIVMSSYRHHPDRDASKCVIKRNLFYFMLMENGIKSLSASIYIYICILPAIHIRVECAIIII